MRWFIATWSLVFIGAGSGIGVAQDGSSKSEQASRNERAAESGDDSGWVERVRGWFEDGTPIGIRPVIGVVTPGSGLAAGAAWESTRVPGLPIGVGVDGMISIHNYQQVAVRAGLLGARRSLPGLRPWDSSISSMIDDGPASIPGTAIYLEHRYRRLPGLSLFGLASGRLERSDFGRSGTATDVVVQWSPRPRLGFGARVGVMTAHLFPGTDGGHPNSEDVLASALDFEALRRARFATAGVGAIWDGRNDPARPTAGAMVQAAAWSFRSASAGIPSFVRTGVDARIYHAMPIARHVFAARLLASFDRASGGARVPFYMMQTLGGSHSLRSFDSYRVRGERLVNLTVESRWQVTRMVDIVPFADLGYVGRPPLVQNGHGLHTSAGIGARARFGNRVVLRADVATGREGPRFVLTFDSPF